MKYVISSLLCTFLLFSVQAQDSLLSYSDGHKWGLTDQRLQVLIPPQFDTALVFNDHQLSVARLQNKYGVIDLKGKATIPFIYEHIYYFDDTCGTGILNGKNTLLNFRTGRPVSRQTYDNAWSHSGPYIVVEGNKKYQILNKATGKPINNIIYDEVETIRYVNTLLKVKAGNKYGIIDVSKNSLLLAMRYEAIYEDYRNDWLVGVEGPLLRYYNIKGKLIKQTEKDKDEDYQYRINDGTVVAPPFGNEDEKEGIDIYVSDLGNGDWGLSLENWENGKKRALTYKVISGYSKVEKLVRFLYPFKSILKVVKNGHTGLIDGEGLELLPAIYEDISFSDSYFYIKKDGKTGMLSSDLKTVVPPILGRVIQSFYGNLFLVEMPDGRQGFMNGKTGKIYIPNL